MESEEGSSYQNSSLEQSLGPGVEGILMSEQQLSASFHTWPLWQVGAGWLGGGGAVGRQQDLSVGKGKEHQSWLKSDPWQNVPLDQYQVSMSDEGQLFPGLPEVKDQYSGTMSAPMTHGGLE